MMSFYVASMYGSNVLSGTSGRWFVELWIVFTNFGLLVITMLRASKSKIQPKIWKKLWRKKSGKKAIPKIRSAEMSINPMFEMKRINRPRSVSKATEDRLKRIRHISARKNSEKYEV